MNPWNDPAGGKTVAETMIAAGVDIIYAAAGVTGLGVFDAAKGASDAGSKTYAIGVDSNQDHLNKGIVLTSTMKRMDVAVETQIDMIVDGSWSGEQFNLGLAEGAVGITPMEFTQAEATSPCGSTTRLNYVNSLAPFIIGGGIQIDEDRLQSPSTYNTIDRSSCPEIIGVTATVTETLGFPDTVTITTTEQPSEATTTKTIQVTETFSETKSEVGIYAPGIGSIIFLGVLTFLIRRRK